MYTMQSNTLMRFLVCCVHSLFLLNILQFQQASCFGFGQYESTYTFGEKMDNMDLTYSKEGYIHIIEKVKDVLVEIPRCTILVYVEVTVYNWLSSPVVNFFTDVGMIRISYKLLQNSFSKYHINGYTVKDPSCGLNPPVTPIQPIQPIDVDGNGELITVVYPTSPTTQITIFDTTQSPRIAMLPPGAIIENGIVKVPINTEYIDYDKNNRRDYNEE